MMSPVKQHKPTIAIIPTAKIPTALMENSFTINYCKFAGESFQNGTYKLALRMFGSERQRCTMAWFDEQMANQ